MFVPHSPLGSAIESDSRREYGRTHTHTHTPFKRVRSKAKATQKEIMNTTCCIHVYHIHIRVRRLPINDDGWCGRTKARASSHIALNWRQARRVVFFNVMHIRLARARGPLAALAREVYICAHVFVLCGVFLCMGLCLCVCGCASNCCGTDLRGIVSHVSRQFNLWACLCVYVGFARVLVVSPRVARFDNNRIMVIKICVMMITDNRGQSRYVYAMRYTTHTHGFNTICAWGVYKSLNSIMGRKISGYYYAMNAKQLRALHLT